MDRFNLLSVMVSKGLPDSSVGKESFCNAGDPSLIPGSGRSFGEGMGYPLQYSGLEISKDCMVHRVSKSQTCLNDFHFQPGAGGTNSHSGEYTSFKIMFTLGSFSILHLPPTYPPLSGLWDLSSPTRD